MKKLFIAIIALSVAGFAHAETAPLKPAVMREMPMQKKMMASTTKNIMMEKKDEMKGEIKEVREKMMTARKDVALEKKDALVKRLTLVLDSLSAGKKVLEAGIEKRVAENKPIGKAKELLVIANTKLEAARKAVAAIVAWKPEPKAASSTEISLTKPRATADAAIKAVRDARQAFNDVMKELRDQIKKPKAPEAPEVEKVESTN